MIKTLTNEDTLVLAPSDFAWLLDDCPACYWYKYRVGLKRPEVPPTRLFQLIDKSMKDALSGQSLAKIGINGTVREKGQKVLSDEIRFDGIPFAVRITGFPDTVIDLESGGIAISDSKTSLPSAASMVKYARQLHSYAYAMANPDPGGKNMPADVKQIGILAFEPAGFNANLDMKAGNLGGSLTWTPFDIDFDAFINVTVRKAAAILNSQYPPAADDGCRYCAHAKALASIAEAPLFVASPPVTVPDDGDEEA